MTPLLGEEGQGVVKLNVGATTTPDPSLWRRGSGVE